MTYFNHHHRPQRGIIPMTTSASRTWLVSLEEAKTHLRIGHTEDDAYITRLTKAAQLVCEKLTGMVLTPCDFIMQCDEWSQTKEIPEISIIKTISYIKYMDASSPSVQQTWSASNYELINYSQRSRISLVDGSSYPTLRSGPGSIEMKFSAKPSWSANTLTALSEVAFQAVLITIADMYENRQSVIVGRIASSIPKTAQYLLDTLKIQTL